MPRKNFRQSLLLLLFSMGWSIASCFGSSPAGHMPPIAFLWHHPIIDGRLDSVLRSLSVRQFDTVARSRNANLVHRAHFRLGYGVDFLYLYIELEKDSIAFRDRAYQNGDGFHLALTLPRGNAELATEFYVLGFSPERPGEQKKRSSFVWYRNVDLSFRPLKGAAMKTDHDGRSIGFELLLPWSDVYPYHPWLSPSMGFNLCLVEAAGDEDKNEHFVLYDQYFQSEQRGRLSRRVIFSPPPEPRALQAALIMERNHLFEGEEPALFAAGIAAPGARDTVFMFVLGVRGDTLTRSTMPCSFGLTPAIVRYALPLPPTLPGEYRACWRFRHSPWSGESRFTVIPRFDLDSLRATLLKHRTMLKPGSVATLEFTLEQMAAQWDRLRSYDSAEELSALVRHVLSVLGESALGRDAIATARGVQRRAYRSLLDSTLQPYSVRVPDGYVPERHYPLLVYLHGSGEDDRGQIERFTADTAFIVLAPNGRGTSNAYSTDHAQEDIKEAIGDVVRNYSVDTAKVLLSGFSMGGYGVYRTFYESPRLFRALAVFSGHPDLANQWLGPGHPDFLNTEYLGLFKGVSIFIFHGGRDRNCPIEKTRELVHLLEQSGAKVEFHLEPDKGHESPGAATLAAYKGWMERVLDKGGKR